MVAFLVALVVVAVLLMLCGAIALLFGRFPPLRIASRWTGLAMLVAGFLLFEAGGIAVVRAIAAGRAIGP